MRASVTADAEDLAHRICDWLDEQKGHTALRATIQARTGQPLTFYPIRPEWRTAVAGLIDDFLGWREAVETPRSRPMSQHEHAEKAVNAAFEQSTEAGLAEILKGARVLVDEVKQSVQNLEDALNHLSANLPTIAEKAKHGKK